MKKKTKKKLNVNFPNLSGDFESFCKYIMAHQEGPIHPEVK